MDLFGQDLLEPATHKAVFGGLPSSLARELRTAEVADLVVQLLDAGWRRGQLAARVEALTSGPSPVTEVTELLRGFVEQVPPDARWREEKTQRETAVARARAAQEAPATPESREQWVRQIRSELSRPREGRRELPRPSRPACSLCGEQSSFFVTREVRLCEVCVGLLATGGVRVTPETQEQAG